MEQLEWNQGPFQGSAAHSNWNGTAPRPFQNQWFHVVVIPSKPAEFHLLFRPLLPPPQLRRSSAALKKAAEGHYGSRTHDLSGAT